MGATQPEDEVIDLRDKALREWEESASLVEYDQDRLHQEMIDRHLDTVAPQTQG